LFSQLKDTYLHASVEPSAPFTAAARTTLTTLTTRLVDVYAKCVTRGDRSLAKQQLRLHQRENIAWERDTVWRQMIGRARHGDGEIVGAAGASLVQEDEPNLKPGMALNLGFARLRITKKKVALLIAIAVFVALLNTQTVDEPEANRCYAVLMFCTLLWATEVCLFRLVGIPSPDKMLGNTAFRHIADGPTTARLLLGHSGR
jgi:phosphate transporter